MPPLPTLQSEDQHGSPLVPPPADLESVVPSPPFDNMMNHSISPCSSRIKHGGGNRQAVGQGDIVSSQKRRSEGVTVRGVIRVHFVICVVG